MTTACQVSSVNTLERSMQPSVPCSLAGSILMMPNRAKRSSFCAGGVRPASEHQAKRCVRGSCECSCGSQAAGEHEAGPEAGQGRWQGRGEAADGRPARDGSERVGPHAYVCFGTVTDSVTIRCHLCKEPCCGAVWQRVWFKARVWWFDRLDELSNPARPPAPSSLSIAKLQQASMPPWRPSALTIPKEPTSSFLL